MKSNPVAKQFALKDAAFEENLLKGAASVTGVMDRSWWNDVIFPGAFKSCLKDFRQNGFVPVGHDWSSLPVAMPTSATEKGNQLLCEAEFHSHQAAQDARTVCMERLAKGLNVGLSIGFFLDYEEGTHYFDNGKLLLQYAKDNGYDMSLFDTRGINACKDRCRAITKVAELVEFSIVSIPANPLALATEAKGMDGDGDAPVPTLREFEGALREAGFTRKQAERIAREGFKGLLRDAEAEPTVTEAVDPRLAQLDSKLLRLREFASR